MKKGFTLIELLIVVLIIAILAAVAVPLYMITIEKGKATEVVKLTRDIYDATERFAFRHNGSIPSTFRDLDIELRGVIPEGAPLTFTNEYATFTISVQSVEGHRTSPTSAIGNYYFMIPRANGGGFSEGAMYCFAEDGKDAVKICSGLSSDDNPQSSGGFVIYRM